MQIPTEYPVFCGGDGAGAGDGRQVVQEADRMEVAQAMEEAGAVGRALTIS